MAIVAKNLTYTYPMRRAPAVNNVSVEFDSGLVSAIEGPNGCGKTTLSKLLTGIAKPQSGEVSVDNEPIKKLSLAEVGKRIGLVMQHPARQLFCSSVKEEMEFGLKNIGLAEEEIIDRKDRYLEYFGLKKYEEKFPFELSTGEKQRLVIGAVIAMNPKYLILDEPTSSLDLLKRAELGKLLRKLVEEENIGIIIISHDEKFVNTFADRRVLMDKGQLI